MAERDALLDGRFVLQGMKWLMEKEKEEGEGRGGRERGGTGCWMDEVDEVVNEKSVSRRRNCIHLSLYYVETTRFPFHCSNYSTTPSSILLRGVSLQQTASLYSKEQSVQW